jgi:hypothetical protein
MRWITMTNKNSKMLFQKITISKYGWLIPRSTYFEFQASEDPMSEVAELDDIRITGTASSPQKRYENLLGTVATVTQDENGRWIKVWPTPEIDGGKIWFNLADVESLEVIRSRLSPAPWHGPFWRPAGDRMEGKGDDSDCCS